MEDQDAREDRERRQRDEREDEEGGEEDRPAQRGVDLRAAPAALLDPTPDPDVGEHGAHLARDVDREHRGLGESVDLLQEDREESIEGGETGEEEEDADQVAPQGTREAGRAVVAEVQVVEHPQREELDPLDSEQVVHEMDGLPLKMVLRLVQPHPGQGAREEAEGRADDEEPAHRAQGAEEERPDRKPHSTDA